MKTEVSAGGVVLNPKGQVLLIKQSGNFTSYSLPKGHVEENEDTIDAAKREIKEETGVTSLNLIRKLGTYKRTALPDYTIIKTIVIYLFTTNQESLTPNKEENTEPFWTERKNVSSFLTHPKDKEFFEKIKNTI